MGGRFDQGMTLEKKGKFTANREKNHRWNVEVRRKKGEEPAWKRGTHLEADVKPRSPWDLWATSVLGDGFWDTWLI